MMRPGPDEPFQKGCETLWKWIGRRADIWNMVRIVTIHEGLCWELAAVRQRDEIIDLWKYLLSLHMGSLCYGESFCTISTALSPPNPFISVCQPQSPFSLLLCITKPCSCSCFDISVPHWSYLIEQFNLHEGVEIGDLIFVCMTQVENIKGANQKSTPSSFFLHSWYENSKPK